MNDIIYVLVDKDGNFVQSYNGIRCYPTISSAKHGLRGYIAHKKDDRFYNEAFIAVYELKEVLKERC